jgi:hypothetical protein
MCFQGIIRYNEYLQVGAHFYLNDHERQVFAMAIKKSLCELVEAGYLSDQPQVYKKLVKKPKYICKHCGRAARKKRNLCRPEKI